MKTYAEIQAEIAKLQEEANEVRKKEVAVVIAEIKEKMKFYGLSISDLSEIAPKVRGAAKRKGDSTKTLKPKYQEPGGTGTWSGRGISPQWFRKALAQGVAKEAMEIK